MQPEMIFIAALAVAVVVIVLAIRKVRRQKSSRGDALNPPDGEKDPQG